MGDNVEIHKPKSWHSWREFLKEYGIIVLGILTALSGEQALEAIHHRSEVAEAREALRAEIEYDLWSVQNQLSLGPCVEGRLKELSVWSSSLTSTKPLLLTRPINGPTYLLPRTSIWRVATTSVVAEMPFQDRVNYANFYDELSSVDGVIERRVALWRELAMAGNGKRLKGEGADKFQSDIQSLQQSRELFETDGQILLEQGRGLHILPRTDAPYIDNLKKKQAAFCKSIIASG